MRIEAPRVRPPSLAHLQEAEPADALAEAGTDGCRIVGAVLDGITRRGVTYRETEFVRATATGVKLTACRFLDVLFDAMDAPALAAAGSTWRDVEIVGSRLGTLDMYDATLSGIRFDHCKIGLLGLPSGQVHDLLVEHCTIEELDLSAAVASRVAFRDTTIGTLRLRDARLTHVDLRAARLDLVDPVEGLRGVAITVEQLVELAPDLAAALGILVD